MDYVIELDGVSKLFGDVRALTDVSLKVQRGEIFGLVGPNGAGKTTAVRLLLGLLAPSSGSIRVLSREVDLRGGVGGQRIGAVLEIPGLYDDLSVAENIQFYARLYRIADWRRVMQSVLEFVGLQDRQHARVRTLSKGMRQKVALARAMIVDPELLIMDEPTSGIDPVFQTDLRQRVLNYAAKGGSVFLCSHNMTEIEELCVRVAILDEGKIIQLGTISEILAKYAGRFFELKLEKPVEDRGGLEKSLGAICSLRQTRSRDVYRVTLHDARTRSDLERCLSGLGLPGKVEPIDARFAGVIDHLLFRESS